MASERKRARSANTTLPVKVKGGRGNEEARKRENENGGGKTLRPQNGLKKQFVPERLRHIPVSLFRRIQKVVRETGAKIGPRWAARKTRREIAAASQHFKKLA